MRKSAVNIRGFHLRICKEVVLVTVVALSKCDVGLSNVGQIKNIAQ